MNFKDINIGNIIRDRVEECGIDITRMQNFLKCDEADIELIFNSESVDTDTLLKLSKLLEFDFFRYYSQHLILYSPPSSLSKTKELKSTKHVFRKNIYTAEVIDFILQQISTKKMTRSEVIEKYNIPKTTLYKWLSKYDDKIAS